MAIQAFSPATIEEGKTPTYRATLLDEDGVGIPLAALTGARLTYSSVLSGTIINARDNQDVLNANNVTIHATSGLLTWKLLEADVIIVESPKPVSVTYRAVFVLEWEDASAVPRQTVREIDVLIQRVADGPFDP